MERGKITRIGVAGLTALTVFGLSSAAFALTPADGFVQCLDGRAPTTQNATALPFDGEAPFGTYMTDIDPSSDEVVLDFNDDLSNDEIVAFAASYGLKVELNSIHSDDANTFVAEVQEGAVPYIKDCLAQKAPEGWLESVEENTLVQMQGAPNDPLYQFQWNFKQVNAEAAWEVSAGKDVVVAVIDTGVAAEDAPDRNIKKMRDLAGTEIVKGYDFVDNDAFAWDGHGHGTHVAGTIAQTTGNKYGVAGLAHQSKIMPLRVLNSRGFGQVSDIADAIRFAADNGAQVINMSLGGPLPSLVMKRAVSYAHKKGVTVVAAAGNGGKRAPGFPAAYNDVIAVAATQFDRHTTFYSQWGGFVDIAAPGGNTRIDQDGDGRPDGVMQETLKDGRTNEHDFALYMGTSMASPHVAAAAALVISQGVTHPDKVEAVLKKTANADEKKRFKDNTEFNERYGAGIMQADAAVRKANVDQGTFRLGGALLLAFLAFVGVRREDMLGIAPKATPLFVSSLVAASSGLFFLPFIFGDGALGSLLATTIARPIAELDMTLLGYSWHQNPLMASALIPFAAIAFLGGHKRLKLLAAGLAIGMSGFLITEAFILTSDVQWIPGMALLDRTWLLVNGVISFGLGYLTLKR